MAKRNRRAVESLMSIETLGTFGEFGRYRLDRLTSRRPLLIELGADVTYAVFDAELVDEVTGLPALIRQETAIDAAVAGLCHPSKLSRLRSVEA